MKQNTTDETTAEALIEGFHSLREVQTEIDKSNFVNSDRKKTILSDSKNNIKKSLEHMNQTIDEKRVVELLIEMMKTKQIEVRVYPKGRIVKNPTKN